MDIAGPDVVEELASEIREVQGTCGQKANSMATAKLELSLVNKIRRAYRLSH